MVGRRGLALKWVKSYFSNRLQFVDFIVFKPNQKRGSYNFQILIHEQQIDQVKETVFLGVIIDENLTGKSEISPWLTKCRNQLE